MQAVCRSVVTVAALVALGTGTASAYGVDLGTLPPESIQGDVKYITGGVGSDEAEAMRQAASRYPLAIELAARASPRAAYVANVTIDIRDTHGRTVLSTTTDGPFLLASLPPGRYTINAQLEGQSQQKTVAIGNGAHQHVMFEFAVDVAER